MIDLKHWRCGHVEGSEEQLGYVKKGEISGGEKIPRKRSKGR